MDQDHGPESGTDTVIDSLIDCTENGIQASAFFYAYFNVGL